MHRITLPVIFFFYSVVSFAQQPNVKGKVSIAILNEQSAALENVTVELLNSKDSALLKSAISDKNGIVEIEGIKPGLFLLKGSMVGYSAGYSTPFSITAEQTSVTIPSLTMIQKTSNQLQGVTVCLVLK